MTDPIDPGHLRDRVRADRHATSYPRAAVGTAGCHDVSFQFSSHRVP